MKERLTALTSSLVLPPSVLKKPRGAPSPVHAPRPWARRTTLDAELRTAPAPSERNYLHPENFRDAASNSDSPRDAHRQAVPLPTHLYVDSHIDRRARGDDACTRVYNRSLEVAK